MCDKPKHFIRFDAYYQNEDDMKYHAVPLEIEVTYPYGWGGADGDEVIKLSDELPICFDIEQIEPTESGLPCVALKCFGSLNSSIYSESEKDD